MEKIDARKLPPEALEHIRRQAFVLRKQGYTWAHIAEVCGVHVGTVLKWSRRAAEGGFDGAVKGGQRGRRHGSGRTLTLVQEEQLRLAIVGSNPAQLKLEFALWNRRAVMMAIKTMFGIEMPIRTVGQYLLRWGFTPQRPVKRALEQDEGKLRQWLEIDYPAIALRAKAEGGEIYWADETAIRQDTHWVRGYAPAGVTPEMRIPAGRHAATTMISAITNQGLVRFTFFDGALDTDRFIAFLSDLIKDAGRKVFLIVDNLKVHRAKRVTEWAAERTDKIELFYLPPYAPEHNPDEYLNRDLKTTLRSGPIARTAHALTEKAKRCMVRIAALPERVRSYFKHEAVRYAQ
ncbi:IS630 family transposase [Pseudothauera rhizosphaerae]|uniref:IS630 family transposase n=1 Tax=Pseudothauera rhizosphaerae TaxID=2565932 RepID=A0A4S4APP7_9RHOO|nr:IS630 family transposase [Pseudothauera rhizosphaerae]THF60400.1 IS630 family transposase [Pseudothauera rhizosphaerae]